MAIVNRNITRVQILVIGVSLIVALCVFSLISRREETSWIEDQKDEVEYETIGSQLYVRDYKGYLYPKGYFDVIPSDTENPFEDVDLEGQHSDTVLPECDDPDGVDPALTYQHIGWIEPPKFLPDYRNPCWYGVDEVGHRVLECIPYFYVIGMSKSGSTDLYFRIQQHPQVQKTNRKEQKFFEYKRFHREDKSDFTYYARQFRSAAVEIERAINSSGYHYKICGDGSPTYSWDNTEWFRLPENKHCLEPRTLIVSYIHHLTPNAKLILILRNPIDRLYSDYLFFGKRTGSRRDPNEFHLWAEDAINKYRDCYKDHPFRFCMYSKKVQKSIKMFSFTSSIYSRIILDILKIFPRNQLLVLEMKDYSANMKLRLRDVYEFLELEPLTDQQLTKISEAKQQNTGIFYNTTGPMLNKTRKMLSRFLQPFNEELAQILGDDKYLWLDK